MTFEKYILAAGIFVLMTTPLMAAGSVISYHLISDLLVRYEEKNKKKICQKCKEEDENEIEK